METDEMLMNSGSKNAFFYPYQQVPLFPIYGYDNSEDAERDFEYMKQLYPRSSRKIQELIEDSCDQLEYEGSIMFDEYPDRLQLCLLANRIYSQVMPDASVGELQETALLGPGPVRVPPGRPGQYPPPPGRPEPNPPHGNPGNQQNPDWLRNMIEVMLCNEMCQRRSRYRSRKRLM